MTSVSLNLNFLYAQINWSRACPRWVYQHIHEIKSTGTLNITYLTDIYNCLFILHILNKMENKILRNINYYSHNVFIEITNVSYNVEDLMQFNCISGVMVSMLTSSRLGQTKGYKIGICCFSAEYAVLWRKSKDWLARNQDSMSKWGDMSICGLLFQWACTIKIQLSMLV